MGVLSERYDILISYRTDFSANQAELIYRDLRERTQWRPFRDVREMDRHKEILPQLERCVQEAWAVVLLLHPQTLHRCVDEPRDYVRQEIQWALDGRKLVPVFHDGYLERELPQSVREFAARFSDLPSLTWDSRDLPGSAEKLIRHLEGLCARHKIDRKDAAETQTHAPLSPARLREPLAAIAPVEPVTIRQRRARNRLKPLDLISVVALERNWCPGEDAESIDPCDFIDSCLTRYERRQDGDPSIDVLLERAQEHGVFDGDGQFVDPQYGACLAGYRLAKDLEASPDEARRLMLWLLRYPRLDTELSLRRRKVLSLALSYWPDGRELLHSCGDSLLIEDPGKMAAERRLDELDRALVCDGMLAAAGWFTDDEARVPLSQRWATATGWTALVPEILAKLVDDPFDRLRQEWPRVSPAARQPFARALRFSGRGTSELREFGAGIICSLPEADASALAQLDQTPNELRTWLHLMAEPGIEPTPVQLRFLVTVLARQFTLAQRKLSQLARRALSSPGRPLTPVWDSLGPHRLAWVNELKDWELDQPNVVGLVERGHSATDPAASRLAQRVRERSEHRQTHHSDRK